MKHFAVLLFMLASVARASTSYAISLASGDALNFGDFFTPGTIYTVAFQLTGGTTSDSTAQIIAIDLGGGSVDPSTIAEGSGVSAGPNGLADGSLTLSITPANSFTYFLEQYTAGSQFQFTVTLNGIYSPPTPDEFVFQLYDQDSNVLYE